MELTSSRTGSWRTPGREPLNFEFGATIEVRAKKKFGAKLFIERSAFLLCVPTEREAMSIPFPGGDFPAVSSAKFCETGLPRPVADPFRSWAKEAQLTMSSLRFDRRRSQGRIDGSIRRLREDEEEEEEEKVNQKKRPKMEKIDSGESEESDAVDGSEEEEEAEKSLSSNESEFSSDSEEEEDEVNEEAEGTTDSEETEDSESSEEDEVEKQEVKGKSMVGCRRSKRLSKVAA